MLGFLVLTQKKYFVFVYVTESLRTILLERRKKALLGVDNEIGFLGLLWGVLEGRNQSFLGNHSLIMLRN